MKPAVRMAGLALLLAIASALSGCGSSSPVNISSSGSGTPSALSCQQRFSPDKLAAGQNCTPQYGVFCPQDGTQGTAITKDHKVTACKDVTVTSGSVSAAGLNTNYVVAAPTNLPANSPIYIALHWSNSNGPTMVDRMRLSEIAKSRKATIVAPTAPGTVVKSWGNTAFMNLVLPAGDTVTNRIALINALIDQVDPSGKKVIMAGDSGGALMAYQYTCAHTSRVAGLLMVAAVIDSSVFSSCHMSAPVPTVQVHGTQDHLGPYKSTPPFSAGEQPMFQSLAVNNGCDPSMAKTATMPPYPTDSPLITGITVQWIPGSSCSSGNGDSLVTIHGGGHNWPGYHGPSGANTNVYGPISDGFDATLQGYDLLKYLGG